MSIKSKRMLLLLLAVCLALFTALPSSASGEKVYVGGNAFGIKFFTKGAVVVGITSVDTASGLVSPADDAGIKAGDIIVAMDGKAIISSDELVSKLGDMTAKSVTLTVSRNGKSFRTIVTPATDIETGQNKLGLYVRDSAAGIGTITYVCADGSFGGLGHGICDSKSGVLLPLSDGAVVNVQITGVVKGVRNIPGELKGDFDTVRVGTLYANTETGVYGKYNRMPKDLGEAVTTAQAKVGKATVLATLGSDGVQSYEIEITDIISGEDTKNLLIRVTDKALLERTGGIVQGMSGSPILQDGHLVGAVTHVLIGDPTRGYGIFIQNMM